MARTGRPRIPSNVHRIRGTYREDRHGGSEPKSNKRRPKTPKYFTGERRKQWYRVIREQEEMGLLSDTDGGVIERLVNWRITADETWQKLIDLDWDGKLQKAKSGYVNIGAYLVAAKMADEMAHKCEIELGRTPQARTRLRAGKPEEVDEFTAYRNMKKRA